ncbi:MAG TPA: c-type cytochrome biogenesis protein CcsB [Dehalococcoidia bacterium]|nr:c-type cytochrome biogenesis protein CcsB [Dehalococcoidia bacterium]
MEELAYRTFLLGFAFTVAASALYVALPLWPRVLYRAAATQAGSVVIAAPGSVPGWLPPAATAASVGALASLTASLGLRWAAAGHPPFANMWEYTVAFTWGIVLFYVLFERLYRQRTLGAVTLPVAATLQAVSLAFFPSEVQPLIPALQSERILFLHVGTMMVAYAALTVSFGGAVLYFVQGGGRRFARLPDASLAEEIAHRAVLVGFPLLALGIALGAWWGNSAWGRYWGWDPKETSALVTWLIYALYLHMRGLRGWRGGRAAVVLIAGYAAVLFSYFAVNLVVSGLHSYAGV